MFQRPLSQLSRIAALGASALVAWLAVFACVEKAHAIPTFSRKYKTSCITCHTVFPKLTNVGEAFRVNGYQFPQDDDILVKEEAVPLGSDSYKDMWPNSVWPSDLPGLPPVFIRAQLREKFNTDPGANGLKWDQDFPHEIALGGAGTFGPDISAWWEIEWEPSEGKGGAIERAFVQFSNLFAWDTMDDDDGARLANRWLTLPPRALNLRMGKMEPQVLAHHWSQHARAGIEQPLPNRQRYYANRFRFEPVQSAAIELHGVIRQYNRYVVGIANGGNVSSGQLEDNNNKDFYFRFAHRWFGFPLDGRLASFDSFDDAADAPTEAASNAMTIRGQSPDDADLFAPAQLDWWRNWAFDTGAFGWWGTSELAPGRTGLANIYSDDFNRIGADARLQWRDWDVYGMIYWGHEEFAGLNGNVNLGTEDFYAYALQADYMIKPWLMGYARYEESVFNEPSRVEGQEGRIVPGLIAVIRQNMKLQLEWVADTTGRDNGGRQATDQLRLQLDYTY